MRRDGCRDAIGINARSLVAKYQTILVLPVRPYSFGSAACGASEGWPVSRLLGMTTTPAVRGRFADADWRRGLNRTKLTTEFDR